MSPEPSKSWWPMNRSSSAKDLRQQYLADKPKGKFNSFTSAIGFKSKKASQPSLTIQDPPLPMQNVPPLYPASPSSDSTRPTSSSTRSRVDSLEPRTPQDYHRPRRQSLLTLSDTDPFAGRPVIVAPVPNLPLDPNRLSAYSNSSVSDLTQRKGDNPGFNRVSYASSSSNSNHHAVEFPLVASPVSPQLPAQSRQVQHKGSKGSMRTTQPEVPSRHPSLRPRVNQALALSLSSSAGPGVRASQPDMVPQRPKLRARGMTDVGSTQRAGFFVEQPLQVRKKPPQLSIVPAMSPPSRIIVRQPSSSRIQTPPSCAPPTQRLPSPPLSHPVQTPLRMYDQPDSEQHVEPSSSRISFSSAISLTNDMFATPFDYGHAIRSSDRSTFSHYIFDDPVNSQVTSRAAPSLSHPLRKSASNHSLSGKSFKVSSPPRSPPDSAGNKPSKKSKNFSLRLPIPPVPSVRPSTSPTSTRLPDLPEFGNRDGTVTEKKRGSTASSVRKRLFSSASRDRDRPSPNQPTSPTEEDSFSLFSLKPDNDTRMSPQKPLLDGTPIKSSSAASFWDEGSPESTPVSPIRPYMPQPILSDADLAKLVESVHNDFSPSEPSSRTRSRGYSVLSASTVASEIEEYIPVGLPPPPRRINKQGPARLDSTSVKAKSPPPILIHRGHSSPPPILIRNDDDNDSLIIPLSTTDAEFPVRAPSPPLALQGLPPPPRPQRRRLVSESQIPQVAPLPVSSHKPVYLPVPAPLSVPMKKTKKPSVRPKISLEHGMHRRSILRKPSFLDIDDDSEPEQGASNDSGPTSFLDLARESFDTVQTGR
ncbi:hypothetical protein CPC08DRAFT_127739 [Agrocybe pediades]|nr:hypothetical protein CPC08DRAFT_127739 [Agrocybe pediades]